MGEILLTSTGQRKYSQERGASRPGAARGAAYPAWFELLAGERREWSAYDAARTVSDTDPLLCPIH